MGIHALAVPLPLARAQTEDTARGPKGSCSTTLGLGYIDRTVHAFAFSRAIHDVSETLRLPAGDTCRSRITAIQQRRLDHVYE